MNILILNWRDIRHPLAGGAEISLWEQAKIWKKNAASITWFSSAFSEGKPEEVIEGIRIIRRGSHFTVHLMAFFYFMKHQLPEGTIVIDSFHFLPFFTPLYLRQHKIVALINEVAGRVWYDNLPYIFAWVGYHVEPYFFKVYKSTQFITASQSTEKELKQLGINPGKIEIVPHGVTIEKVSELIHKEKDPVILFLNRISKDKGIEDALQAFSIVKKQIPEAKLWIVGKEENKGFLDSLLKAYIINLDSIKYFGYVEQKKKFELLKKSWILIHLSKKEGWGLTVIEAASQGTPTVGYNVEGLRDSILDRKTGLLTSESPTALANGVLEILHDNRLYTSLSSQSHEWARKFDWERSGKHSWGVINSL